MFTSTVDSGSDNKRTPYVAADPPSNRDNDAVDSSTPRTSSSTTVPFNRDDGHTGTDGPLYRESPELDTRCTTSNKDAL